MTPRAKKILIFGAGINQLELIREAKELGIISVVIDPQPDPPGKLEADFFYEVKADDYETTKQIALKHNIDGIVTGQMEKPLRLMAKLAKELNMIFHSPLIVERCTDKWLMKESFLLHGVPCARGLLINSGDELNVQKIGTFSFPLIIKPRDAFSSRGVYRTETIEELKARLDESRSFASSGDVIIEEFLEGKEYSVEAITFNGGTTIVQFTEKFITPYPNTVEIAHLQPADLTESEKLEIKELVISGIEALGINNSASHIEVMKTKKGPKIIEIGARLGGDFIASYLTKASTGVSMDKTAIQIALGIEPDLCPSLNHYSLIQYLNLPTGKKVKTIIPYFDICDLPGVIMAHVLVKKGDIIPEITHSALRPGWIIVHGLTRNEVICKGNETINLVSQKIILEENDTWE